MFVFGLILTAPGAKISHKRASLVKKGVKTRRKVRNNYIFVRKKYRNIRILDKSERATCAFVRARCTCFLKRESYFVLRRGCLSFFIIFNFPINIHPLSFGIYYR